MQIQAVLDLLKDLGHAGVPTLKTFQTIQERARRMVGVRTVQKTTPGGKIFYQNPVIDQVAMVSPLFGARLDELELGSTRRELMRRDLSSRTGQIHSPELT